MDEGMESIAHLSMYELVNLPPGCKAIGTTWVYQVKHNNAGEIMHFKAHLYTQGFSQIPGINFQDTYHMHLWPQLSQSTCSAPLQPCSTGKYMS
jgi:hypothetical protein